MTCIAWVPGEVGLLFGCMIPKVVCFELFFGSGYLGYSSIAVRKLQSKFSLLSLFVIIGDSQQVMLSITHADL